MAQNTVRVSLIADAQKFKSGMAEAERATGKFEKQTETAGQKLSNFGKVAIGGLVAGAGAALIGFLGDAAKAAADDQLAQEQLALALKNTTGATDIQVKATEDWIRETALATGVADDELRPALAELVRRTDDLALSQDLLGTAMDISRAKGKPLQAVVEAIGKAADGNVGALGRLGVATKDADGKALSFAEAMAEADRTMGDAAETFAESEAGAMARFQVRLDELTERIGTAVIPAMEQGADKVSNFLDAVDEEVNLGWSQRLSAATQTLLGESEESVAAYIAEKEAINDAADAKRRYGESIQKGMGVLDAYNQRARDGKRDLDALAGATEDVTAAVRDNTSALQEAADPALAALKASQRLKSAQDKYNEAVRDSGPLSDEARDAGLDLAVAQGEMEGAAKTFAEQGGAQSIEALEIMMGRAGLTTDLIDDVRRALERLNSTPINRTGRDVTGRAGDQRTEFHSGGVVAPGLPVGTPVAATLLAGESVAPIGHSSHNGHRGGGSTVINVTVNALDPQGAAKAVVQALQTYNRQNGGIPIVVRSP